MSTRQYLKILLAGILGAVCAVLIWVAALLGWSLWAMAVPHEGAGVVAIVVDMTQIVLAGMVGFAVGVWWDIRRRRQPARLNYS